MIRPRSFVVTLLPAAFLTCGVIVLPGCGDGEKGSDETASTLTEPSQTSGGKSKRSAKRVESKPTLEAAYVDERGRKFVAEDFPLDALYFDDPIAVARQEGTVAAAPAGQPDAAPETSQPAEPAAATSSGSDIEWKEVVPATVVDDEVTKVNNRLRAKLQTLATYNSSFLELPPHVTTMALMAEIAARHPDEVRWKENARHIRDLAAEMLGEKLQRGAKSYKQMNEPYLKIGDILRGSPPPGLSEPTTGDDFSEFADMGFLMKRFKIGAKWLQVNVGTEEALKENAEDVKHEAGVLAALAVAITTEGYGYADDSEFKGFANGLVEGTRKVSEAADTGNLENYQLGFSQIDQACTKCHSDYR